MIIREIYIQSFGKWQDRSFSFADGVNIVEGPNESGKSTIAAFLKYIFYGPGQKGSGDRTRYLTGSRAGGWVTLLAEGDGKLWRIERHTTIAAENGRETLRDQVQILDTRTNQVLPEKEPGMYFFGVNESVFVNTAFAGQLHAVRPEGSSLSGAVENMLHTADENVDLRRATDRLQQVRRELYPKNSTGGKIREKEEELARLEEALTAARDKADRQRGTENALHIATAKRQEMEEKKDALTALTDAAGVISACRKLAAAEDTATKLKSYQNALDVLTTPPYSDLAEKLDAIENTTAETVETPEPKKRQPTRNAEAAAALEEGEYLESRSRLFLAITIVMAICGLVSLAAGAIMTYFGFPQFYMPFIAMVAFVAFGIVFYVMQGKNLARLDAILDDFGVDTLDELDELTEEDEPASVQIEKKAAPWYTDKTALSSLRNLADACGVEMSSDPVTVLAALRKKAEKAAQDRATVRAKVDNLTGRLGALEEAVADLDRNAIVGEYKQLITTPIGKAAMQLDSDGLAKAIKERDFTIGTWRAQSKKEADLTEALSALTVNDGRTPDMLAGLVATAKEELHELKKQHAGYTMALEALQTAGENLRTTVIPTVTSRASHMMEQATGGKYASVAMDADFGLRYTSGGSSGTVDMLSKGTADLAYISLRLALAETLFGDKGREIPPMLLDETFAAVDCTRLSGALEAMCHAPVQCILFTCRGDEARIGKPLGCTVIPLTE